MTKKIRLYQPFGDLGCQRPVMPEYQYSAKKDYTLKFLIRVSEA